MDQFSEALVKGTLTIREWLNYYLNIWMRNAAARTIDVEMDKALVQEDQSKLVLLDQPEGAVPQQVKVIRRLENRKKALSASLSIVNATKALLEMSDEQLAEIWSEDALKPNLDLEPRKYRVIKEDGLTLPDGQKFAHDVILTIDPTEDELKKYLEDGSMEEVKEGEEQAKEAPAKEESAAEQEVKQ